MIVAEDDPDDQLLLQSAINDTGFPLPAIFMTDGGEVIQYLANADSLPKLVILDLNMPRMNGIQVLEFISARALNKSMRVHVFSTSNMDIDKKKCDALGAASYTVKPDNYRKLVDWLEFLKNNI